MVTGSNPVGLTSVFNLYGLTIGFSILLTYHLASQKNHVVPEKKIDSLFFGLIISGIIGARLYHIFDYFEFYRRQPLQILNLKAGGLGIYGALIAGLIFIYHFSKKNQLDFFKITDLIAPYLPLAQSISRLGNFFNHEIPFWWLEALLNLSLFLLIQKFPQKPTAKYLIGYGLIRFFFEFFRPDTWQISGLKTAQIISISFILIGLQLLKTRQN